MFESPTLAAVRSVACASFTTHADVPLFVRWARWTSLYGALCLLSGMTAGCVNSASPIQLTQWSWGRSLSLSRNQTPKFDSVDNDNEDSQADSEVTVVDPETKPKEPRRIFGFGSNRSKSDEDVVTDGSSKWRHTPDSIKKNNLIDETQQRRQADQYAKAEELFNAGQFDEAQALLKPLSKKRQQSFWSKLAITKVSTDTYQDHNRVREDSLFLLAESYFKQERYNNAKEHYEALLKDYPSTRHLNVSTRRLFVVARNWLGMPEFATTNDITPVNLEDPRSSPTPKREKPPHSSVLVPNFSDKSRPSFDTPGHALEALKSIWMYDPRGPLADDAIMLTASHYLRVGNYQEADRYFAMLREEYPSSPHLQTSFVLGSHVKLMSYQGAEYDSKQLEDARLLKESTLRLFPNLKEKERLNTELDKIEEARAQRVWELVDFYRRKRLPKAMVIHAEELLQDYPDTSYAPQARDVLADLQPDLLEKYPGPRSARVERRKAPRKIAPDKNDDSDTSGKARVLLNDEE